MSYGSLENFSKLYTSTNGGKQTRIVKIPSKKQSGFHCEILFVDTARKREMSLELGILFTIFLFSLLPYHCINTDHDMKFI